MHAGRRFRVRALGVGVAASLLTMLALGTFAGAGTTASKSGFSTRSSIDRIKVTCALNLIAVLPPRTTTAENFGTVDCGSPFGKGVQHDSSVVTGTPGNQLTGSLRGPFEQFFDNGKLSGHFHIDYTREPALAGDQLRRHDQRRGRHRPVLAHARHGHAERWEHRRGALDRSPRCCSSRACSDEALIAAGFLFGRPAVRRRAAPP